MSLDKALDEAVKAVPECVAAGYVDTESGMLLGVKTVDSHPSEVLDLVAAATADLFQGKTVVEIENIFKKRRGVTDARHYFQEIVVFSDNLLHVFIRGGKLTDHVCVFVCRKGVNIGMALTKARAAVPALEAAF
ncbi:MAG: hypothetical protein SFU56_18215 [Capsulimonadales bacterium]|nr:hypothetical protein [Capsulimonadales bacterium]